MVKNIKPNHILIFLFLASSLALISAFIAQYVFDYQPCILCLYQRKPFFIVMALTIFSLAFFKKRKAKKIVILLCALTLLINAGIAFYHVGVEQKFFKGFGSCSAESLNQIQDLEELKIAMSEAKIVRCDEPQFFFLSLTMAAWNVIFCGFLALITLFVFRLVI